MKKLIFFSFLIIGLILFILSMIPIPECYKYEEEVKVIQNICQPTKKIQEYSQKEEFNIDIVGISMQPFITHNDNCRCEKTNDYKIFDIITFSKKINENQSIILSHRILWKNKEGYITRGDNNKILDPFIVREENIICEIVQKSSLTRTIKFLFTNSGYWMG